MANMNVTSVYGKSPNIVFRRILDEVILVPIQQNVADDQAIFTLNETAARVWDLLDGNRPIKEIQRTILDEFDVGSEMVEADLAKCFCQLIEIGAIIEEPGVSS